VAAASRAAALARGAKETPASPEAAGAPSPSAHAASAAPSPTAFPATASAAPARSCTLRTDPAGRIEVRLPRGPSRTLRMSFRGDALLLPASGKAAIRTPARARLRVTPAVVRAGGGVRFNGRLLGGHVPRAGKVVEVQALVGAGWRTFATVRSDRRGRLRHRHRFAPTSAGRTFWFRLRVPRESAYPYETGTSRAVAVRVS
jgi:hypothetical protein